MKIRLTYAGCLATAGILAALPVYGQYWKERAFSNPFTQGYKAFNPYVGGYGDVSSTVGYNPCTGTDVSARYYRADTGTYGPAGARSDPATAPQGALAGANNPSAGNADRDKVGYNPYTGNAYVSGRSYDARTGQRMLYAQSYNPMTGDGR